MSFIKQINYPNIPKAWAIFFVTILGQLIASPILLLTGRDSELGIFVSYTLGMLIGLGFALYQKSNWPCQTQLRVSLIEKRPFNPLILIVSILAIPCIHLISGPITQFIPIPDSFLDELNRMVGDFGIFSFLTIVIAAPILEELIFRGIILDGFLKNYSPTKAIIYSSLMFGLIHMNPWQFINATLIGVFLAWLYYRTRSIWPCIFLHMANNGLIFFAAKFVGVEAQEIEEPSIIMLFVSVIFGIGMLFLLIQLIERVIDSATPNWQDETLEEEE
ncbi:MAG: CPBP family intramembrane metalloprotease [Bacteroidia bacterium]|nr:CPBP family intramembrane metalloprotease [Bacteroidia bacterium]